MVARRVGATTPPTARDAGATIDVWNAWLTGMRTACIPAAVNASMAANTAVGGTTDHGLVVGVDVGDDCIPRRVIDDPLDLGERPEHGGHRSVVLHRQARHLVAARAHGLERGVERERAGSDQRAVLTEAVPHHHVGAHAVGGEQAVEARVGRQHGWLGDLGLEQLLLELTDGRGVVTVDEDVGRERPSEQRRHDGVGLAKRVGHDRLGGAETLRAC